MSWKMDKIPCDTNSLCRTCMCEAPLLVSLYDNINPRMKIMDALVFVTDMAVSQDDLLPKQVCSTCEALLLKFEVFKRRCYESEAKFYTILNKDQSSEIKSSAASSCDVLTKVEKAENQMFGTNIEFDGFVDALSTNVDTKNVNLESVIKQEIDDHEYDCGFENTEVFSDIICELCDKKFKSSLEKHDHDMECHKESHKVERRNSEDIALTELSGAGKLKKCNICIKWFPAKKFNAHIRKHKVSVEEKYECSECLRKFVRKETLLAHTKRHQNPTAYSCDICKRTFKHKAHLNNHILTAHSTENSLKCMECLETFESAESLAQHITTHQHKKKHKCEFCSKSFHMLSTLKDHLRVHTGEKPYLCPTCGKGFSQNTNLIEHIRRHQGIKPFKCEHCPKAFVSKGELSAHRRTHTGAHPFVCGGGGGGEGGGCGARFTTASSLAKHRRAHSGERPYACDLCPMRFAASGTLKNHRRTHTGEKPHRCDRCDKSFVQRNDLVAHTRCHTGERPYACLACPQAFRQSSALKAHVKMHASKELSGSK